ncbi:uncharacterized protein PADG_02127 [Paracoccidioides brasiliensis Pb18]|uniref:Uncharacterized protein n=1 Tax=Paracoccidioides brasiliensis (strain Pb18) TaxID=502780 RepID=C1G1W1_PARBD|nr:uncharacterized protein PADG_02127 [Paracoccidioides brasiliensis Pb18]EEH45977.2 hypothetical protein PADG_02127 [Paracoccidioides brasiliensis Pb18]
MRRDKPKVFKGLLLKGEAGEVLLDETASIDTRKLLTGEQKAPSPYFHGFFRGNAVANSYVKSPLSISQATDMLDLRLLLPPLSRIPTTPQNRSRGADHADDMFGLQPQVKSCGGLESNSKRIS